MDKDKQIQKVNKYSLEKIKQKSGLAIRGFQDLGLFPDKSCFTIIYVCQFCGRFVNYSLSPCIFCGRHPKTKIEVIYALSISSSDFDINELAIISRGIKGGKPLEDIVVNIKECAENILNGRDPLDNQKPLDPKWKIGWELSFKLAEIPDHKKRSRDSVVAICSHCKKTVNILNLKYDYCINCQEKLEEFTPSKKFYIALNSFLQFIEDDLDFAEDDNTIDELILRLVYLMNNLVEKSELPGIELLEKMKMLLYKVRYFGSNKLGFGIKLEEGKELIVEVDEDRYEKELEEIKRRSLPLLIALSYIFNLNIFRL